MAGTQVKVDDSEVKAALKGIIDKMGSLRDVLDDFGKHMILTTRERFDSATAPDGSPWKPLSPLTLLMKKTDQILVESAELRDSIIYTADDRSMAYGTNKLYGGVHQFGGLVGREKAVDIPARPFLGFNDADFAELVEICKEHLELTE